MDDDSSLGADLAAAMGDTSTQTPADTTTSTGDASATTGLATTPPADATLAPVTTDPTTQGPIPFQVHHTALANARTKAVQEAQAQWDAEHGWAKTPGMREIAERVARSQGNPIAFFAEQFDELANDARFAPALRSFIGQRLGQFRGQGQGQAQTPQALTMPDPDVAIYDAQGNVVGQTYSAQAQAQRETILKQQLLQEVARALGPRMQTMDTLAAEAQAKADDAAAQQFASSFTAELQALPGFDLATHGPAMAAELRANRLSPHAHPSEVNAAAYRAYTKIVLPTLNSQNRRDIVTTQQQKGQVNTASPSTGSTGTPKSYADMTWSEAFQHELAKR